MKVLLPTRNYIIIKHIKEFAEAKLVHLCRHIIYEDSNNIYIWNKFHGKWIKSIYSMFGQKKEKDLETTGLKAYQNFYSYCGREEVERMKSILQPISIWESHEQLHYANVDFAGIKIYKNIYEYDANSAFTYGVFQLEDDFDKLKEYMQILYNKKEESQNEITRNRYKNLQNYLIGYFARIKEFIALRSEIIHNSNKNIRLRMAEIFKRKGIAYLSSTDSIITDDAGREVMEKYTGTKVGQFKLKKSADKLFYKSSNCYQIGEKVVYSGVKYFARKHTDFFKEEFAQQNGNLIEGFDFDFEEESENYRKICKVQAREITVTVFNKIGEVLDIITYKPNKEF